MPKKFVRSYYCIKNNKSIGKYIPDFDKYTIAEMRELLTKDLGKKIDDLNDMQVKRMFNAEIHRHVQDLEEDLQNLS